MGVDLTVAVRGKVDLQARKFIDNVLMQGFCTSDFNIDWTPYWNEKLDKAGVLWTYCFPGDRYIGCDDPFAGCMNLHKLPRLFEIYAAFATFVDFDSPYVSRVPRSIYFLADHKIPTQFDEPMTIEGLWSLNRIFETTKEKTNG